MNVSDLIDSRAKELLSANRRKRFYGELAETESMLRMSLNENVLIDKSFSNTLLQEVAKRIDARRYPSAKGGTALKAISEYIGAWEDQIIVGNGSDEIIELAAKVFVGGGEAIVVSPTFEMYKFYVSINRGIVCESLLNEGFDLSASEVLSVVNEKTKAIFICSPNNPTGKQFSRDEVLRVVEESDRLVVLDEAYADFAPYSLTRETTKYNNLLILRTFSKAFGLAGLRIGYGVGDSEIIEWLRAAQSPFSVNSVAQEMCKIVLENRRVYESFVNKVKEERKYLLAELQMINGIKTFDSDANFILFRVIGGERRSEDVAKRLMAAGIEVRDRGGLPMLSNCLRVTVADWTSDQKFVKELEKAMREPQ
jgi:histidinol-phosphate aminotransferase